MFKTVVTVLVSMMMTAGAAVGLDVDQSRLMSNLRSKVSQSTQVAAEFAPEGIGLQTESETSADVGSEARASQDNQGDHEQSAEAQGDAEASVQVESRVESEGLKQLWAQIRARFEAAIQRVKDEARKIEVDADFQGEGHGSLEAEGRNQGSVDVSSGGSASGEASVSGEKKESDFGRLSPILEGSLDIEGEAEGEVNSSGQ